MDIIGVKSFTGEVQVSLGANLVIFIHKKSAGCPASFS